MLAPLSAAVGDYDRYHDVMQWFQPVDNSVREEKENEFEWKISYYTYCGTHNLAKDNFYRAAKVEL